MPGVAARKGKGIGAGRKAKGEEYERTRHLAHFFWAFSFPLDCVSPLSRVTISSTS